MQQTPFAQKTVFILGVALLVLGSIFPACLYFHFPRPGQGEGRDTVIYSPSPPATYRWLRGDGFVETTTAMLYAAGFVIAAVRIVQIRRGGQECRLWPPVSLAMFCLWWLELGPEPAMYRLRAFVPGYLLRSDLGVEIRIAYAALLFSLLAVLAAYAHCHRGRLAGYLREERHQAAGWFCATGVMLLCAAPAFQGSVMPWLRVDPPNYVKDWMEFFGAAFLLLGVATRYVAERHVAVRHRPGRRGISAVCPLAAAAAGIGCMWLATSAVIWHRTPLYHFGVVTPGKVYRSGQPRYRDLWLAHKYYRFRTILNLHTPGKSPYWKEEVEFARRHGIEMYSSEIGAEKMVELFQDPAAWPILVHCRTGFHRTTARLGLYWVVSERRPLEYVFRQIEQISGIPAKRKFIESLVKDLPRVAPERFPDDRSPVPSPRMSGN